MTGRARQERRPSGRRRSKTLVICDFDGTVSTVDIGNRFMNRFTGSQWDAIDKGYLSGEVGSREAYKKGLPLFKIKDKSEAVDYCLEVEKIDPAFAGFYLFCLRNGVDLVIASDGFDFYIDAVLKRYSLYGITFFSNHAVFEDGRFCMTFPHASTDCGRCGTCKNGILKKYRKTYGSIIYVGDGSSDVCPSRNADLVFAKRTLLKRCLEEGRACIPFETFVDVEANLAGLGYTA